jgi:CheY-like chemotaxis protein
MGGERGVTSTLGQGSTFWFTVQVTGDTAASPAGHDEGLAGADVLVVDDSAAARSILDQYLRDWGMVVTTASSSTDAVTALQAAATNGTPFAVALVDERISGRADVVAAVAGGGRGMATRLVLRGLPESGSADERHRAVRTPLRIEELRLCLRHVLGLPAGEATNADVPAFVAPVRPHLGRVLLAEDNLVNQKITVAMLTKGGYQVDTVLDGAAAITAAAAIPYGAILMDCQMPILDGYEATAAIRAQEHPHRHTPIIALTAGSRAEDEQRCLDAGMDRYLTKPISKEGLLAAVAESIALVSA